MEAERRLHVYGPNALRSHGARAGRVLARQLRNPLLLLLLAAAAVSGVTGDPSDAVIIGVIVGLSVGLGFVNEFRSEQAVEALHSQIRHTALVVRAGAPSLVDVTALVPGDVLELALGDIVPADIRLLDVTEFECDEGVLTGESLPVGKCSDAVLDGDRSCALMGTIVREGSPRRRGAHRNADRVRAHRRRTRRTTHGDRIPGRVAQVLVSARAGRRRADRIDLRHQPRPAPTVHRRAPVLARDRDRPDPTAAPGDRDGEPLDRVAAAGPAQGAREATGQHRGSRQHQPLVHRQDRHPDRRPHHLRPRGRRRRRGRAACAIARARLQRSVGRPRPCGQRQRARRRALGRCRSRHDRRGAYVEADRAPPVRPRTSNLRCDRRRARRTPPHRGERRTRAHTLLLRQRSRPHHGDADGAQRRRSRASSRSGNDRRRA